MSACTECAPCLRLPGGHWIALSRHGAAETNVLCQALPMAASQPTTQ